jgi:hypothetical protein
VPSPAISPAYNQKVPESFHPAENIVDYTGNSCALRALFSLQETGK